jgi:hypothetical protein
MGGPHPRRPNRLNPPPRGFQAPTPRAAAEKHPTTGTRQASHSRASCSRTSHSRVSHSRASPNSRSLFCFAIVNVRIYESNKISYYILLSTYKKISETVSLLSELIYIQLTISLLHLSHPIICTDVHPIFTSMIVEIKVN